MRRVIAIAIAIAIASRLAHADGVTYEVDVGEVIASGGNPTVSGAFVAVSAGYEWQLCPGWLHIAALGSVSSQREVLDLGYGQRFDDPGLGMAGRVRAEVGDDVSIGARLGTFTCALCRGLEDPRLSLRLEAAARGAIAFVELRYIRWDALHRPSPFSDERSISIGLGYDGAHAETVRLGLAFNDAAVFALLAFATRDTQSRSRTIAASALVFAAGGPLAHLAADDPDGATTSALLRGGAGAVFAFAAYDASTCRGEFCGLVPVGVALLTGLVVSAIDLARGRRGNHFAK